jgi:hypothetical protein
MSRRPVIRAGITPNSCFGGQRAAFARDVESRLGFAMNFNRHPETLD